MSAEIVNSPTPHAASLDHSTNQNYTPAKTSSNDRTSSPLRNTPTTHSTPVHPTTFMTPQEITERIMEQKQFESPVKWISASKRIYGESEIAEKKAELSVKNDRELLRDWTNLDRERNDYLTTIKKKINTFKVGLDHIRNKLHDKPLFYDKPTQDNLEQLLENYENKIASFKLVMKNEFDQLENSEELLLKDIYRVDQLILSIEEEEKELKDNNQLLSPESNRLKVLQQQQQNQQRLEEDMEFKAAVGEADRELAALGRFGNWDPRDHDAFLRVWNGYFGSLELVHYEHNEWIFTMSQTQLHNLLKKLEFNVFGKTLDELKEHIEWYSQVLKLLAKKKKLLSDWKRIQVIRKKFATQEAAASEQILLSISKSKSRDSNDGLSKDEKNKEMDEKRLNAKMRIAKWKNDKAREQEQLKIEENERLANEQKRSQEERKRRQMEVQVKLEEWKTTKAKESFQNQTTTPRTEAKHVDEETLRKRAERDLEVAKERKQRADMQALKKKERERRLSEIPGSKFNVESKLHSATKASEAGRIREEDLDAAEHRRHSTGAHGSAVAMNARDLQFTGRAQPLWMKPMKT
eukprot:CAMPEP_0173149936 /NCGR_PEP_ID=MMETSP1105-20130129/10638_1 /TAXON_ID=2985 /ORGANISM="Ochromonas sp., Strain BG-1" /LENGTH=578 /DNA_ID=CAMNT_0014064929 /DNA_START=42 /DNA_END=1778 /DNA_ORIENTATION=-